MANPIKQNLLPNLSNWIGLTIAVIALFTMGLFEQRTRFELSDGTVLTGKVTEEDDASVTIERASGTIQTLAKNSIKDRNWFNIEVDIKLGLDLKGGTSLRYSIANANPEGLDADALRRQLEETVETFRKRLDARGVQEISCVAAPPSDILIELPGVTMEESLAYEQVIQRLGTLEFIIVAQNAVADNLDVTRERARVQTAWDELKKTQPTAKPNSLNLTQFDVKGGSGRTYRWYPYSAKGLEGRPDLELFPFELLERSSEPRQNFTGEAIKNTFPDQDNSGRPALGFQMKPERAADFGEFTTTYKDRLMAIVLDGEIHSAPNLESTITERGIIQGGVNGFTTEDLKALTSVFKSGSLAVKPTLLSKSTIGPSLGEASIRRGVIAGIVASIIVVGFILWFYGFIGILSSITLLAGVYYLVGGLGFLDATLTMPGIAGIVLTIGMAIDQNILVNERIREERQKGKTVPQSIKNGFDRAFVTIFDAQATTFLTGWILYYFGTGPIQGFAVSTMLGIVVTMFAAIVGQKILFAIGLEREWFKELNLRHVFANLNISFTKYFKKCAIGSTVVCGGGMIFFLAEYESLRGLDFAGGFQTRIALSQPVAQTDVEALVHQQFASANIVSMSSVDGARVDQDYLVKIRAEDSAEAAEGADLRAQYVSKLESVLTGKLVAQGLANLAVTTDQATQKSHVKFTLNLDRPAPATLIEQRIRERSPLKSFAPNSGESASFEVELDYATVVGEDRVRADVSASLKELPGNVGLSDPMPESLMISSKVGKELRDKSILAMFWSIIGILIYVRIRFADFAWGLAACAALVHDVAISLGGMAVAHSLGIVDCELDLVTIGAVLTLIGFSLNDTIVIFDRVRENRQRNPSRPLLEIIDDSLNQTMSRTILTSSTVFFALLVLFVVNFGQRNVLEGFSFVMLIGVVSGTYSTIYIASPLLWWLSERKKVTPSAATAASKAVTTT
jgi:SecD/SecF fusion protein